MKKLLFFIASVSFIALAGEKNEAIQKKLSASTKKTKLQPQKSTKKQKAKTPTKGIPKKIALVPVVASKKVSVPKQAEKPIAMEQAKKPGEAVQTKATVQPAQAKQHDVQPLVSKQTELTTAARLSAGVKPPKGTPRLISNVVFPKK